MPQREPALIIADIREAGERVISYARQMSFADLQNDRKTIDAVLHNLMIIGEAANRLPDTDRARYPAIDWRRIIAFRNIVVHEYFGVDLMAVWGIVTMHLPELLATLPND